MFGNFHTLQVLLSLSLSLSLTFIIQTFNFLLQNLHKIIGFKSTKSKIISVGVKSIFPKLSDIKRNI